MTWQPALLWSAVADMVDSVCLEQCTLIGLADKRWCKFKQENKSKTTLKQTRIHFFSEQTFDKHLKDRLHTWLHIDPLGSSSNYTWTLWLCSQAYDSGNPLALVGQCIKWMVIGVFFASLGWKREPRGRRHLLVLAWTVAPRQRPKKGAGRLWRILGWVVAACGLLKVLHNMERKGSKLGVGGLSA